MKSESIAVYARVSSDRQAEGGTIESQLAALREGAQQQGYSLDEDLVFSDNGVSGASLVRPGLDKLRDKAAAGEIDKVLVLCPDRLARKHAHQLILVEEFKRLGVGIEFLNHKISETPEDQLLLQIQGVISEYEREKIIERGRRGKLHKAKSGKVTVFSMAPYGYAYIPQQEGQEARLEIHSEEAEVVRKIFQLYIVQRLSVQAIARRLTQEGIPTRKRAQQWSGGVIYGMLKNPVYSGKAAYGKKQYIQRKRPNKISRERNHIPSRVCSSSKWRPKEDWIFVSVPAVLDAGIFEAAQQQLEEHKRFSARNSKNDYLLGSLVRCQGCGYRMYGKLSTPDKCPKKFHYYRCVGLDGYRWASGKQCSGHPIRIEVLDDLVWEKVKQLLQEPEVTLNEYTQRVNKKNAGKLSLEDLLRKKEKEKRQQEVEKERLLDLYQEGKVSKDEIEHRLSSIRQKIKKTENEHAFLEREKTLELRQLQVIEQLNVFRQKLLSNLDQLDFKHRKTIIQLLVSDVIVNC